mmetsp:Transcript_52985/g.158595  ORF Transcript_52985/g.158595 Transcript_52985/m.158595 type:complete len:561 (-) Transcript_52985:22-1704(-)|eukprot:CAMPEP_0113553742 /NCGR_PEP_ID=MMETSP0015_2-20120614/15775_1 /TAXON_ID=2838 /ORGANISM="Odontella" /LENGTH=560 /DNA_ID=CAMNT_0000454831 /DNA_START=273 /DNA_END=1955 /DNA_ORIENTATION=+ /assembly_acc=CAM_ASM_000160
MEYQSFHDKDDTAVKQGREARITPAVFGARGGYDEVFPTSDDKLLSVDRSSDRNHADSNAAMKSQGALDATFSPSAAVAPNVATEISIDNAIDSIGTGRFQRTLLVAAGLCFMADSMEIMLLSFLSGILEAEWGLSGEQTASITSCVFAGSLTGTLVWGALGDKIGRKPVFIICAFLISVFGVATAFTTEFVGLLVTRFMVGFGVGGLTVPFDVLAEFLPTEARGKYLMYIEYFWTAGSMGVPVLAFFTIGRGASWRIFVVLCAIPCLASAVIGMYCVPESPRWLVSQGRTAEAKIILRQAAVINGMNPDDIISEETGIRAEDKESSRFLDLLKPKWRKLNIRLWGTWFGFGFGYYGTIIAVTRVFGSENDEGGDHAITGDDTVAFDYGAIFISSSAELLGTIMVILTIDRIGRVPTQVLAYCVGGISLFLLCIFSTTWSRSSLVTVAFFARVSEMMGSCTTWIITAEVLSTEIRTTGHSAANALSRLGGFVSPYVVAGNYTYLPLVGIIMLLVHGLTAFCASRLPETKGRAIGKVDYDADQISPVTELPVASKEHLHLT